MLGDMTDRGPDLATLRTMCARTGCTLRRAHNVGGGHAAYTIECHTHPNKVALLDELASYDATCPEVRALAERLSQAAGGDAMRTAAGIHRLVQGRVRHIHEAGEVFTHTMRTLEVGRGDCDDTARAIVALLRAIGIPANLRTVGNPPRHVYAEAQIDGRRCPLEATIAANPGEPPLVAARRLGIRNRDDL